MLRLTTCYETHHTGCVLRCVSQLFLQWEIHGQLLPMSALLPYTLVFKFILLRNNHHVTIKYYIILNYSLGCAVSYIVFDDPECFMYSVFISTLTQMTGFINVY